MSYLLVKPLSEYFVKYQVQHSGAKAARRPSVGFRLFFQRKYGIILILWMRRLRREEKGSSNRSQPMVMSEDWTQQPTLL